jgi:3-methyl-2-oxobutanoate hydroxymethyltransferase
MPPKVQTTPAEAGAASSTAKGARPKVSRAKLGEMKKGGERIVMVTAYDYPFARLADAAGVDILLVGDTLGMVVLGFESTLPVTMEHMIHHTQAVSRARPSGMIVGDMPFMSYQVTTEEAVRNAGRLGHIGLTPQAVHQLGGYRVQGRDRAAAERLASDAHVLQESGCFALVLEAIPVSVAQQITTTVRIPTIGIGAGPHCDGQVLVLHDLLGLYEEFVPKFVRRYADLAGSTRAALEAFAHDVRSGRFPGKEHSYS